MTICDNRRNLGIAAVMSLIREGHTSLMAHTCPDNIHLNSYSRLRVAIRAIRQRTESASCFVCFVA